MAEVRALLAAENEGLKERVETEMQKDVGEDGTAETQALRALQKRKICVMLVIYLVGGVVFYHLTEGWSVLEGSVFALSVVTGEFLESVMEVEKSSLLESVKHKVSGVGENAGKTYQEEVQDRKKHQFITGSFNIIIFGAASVLYTKFIAGEDWAHSIYLSSIYVLQMDSLCAIDSVKCNHKDSNASSLLSAIAWYFVSYGVVGHFLVSASKYLSSDPDATVSRVRSVTAARIIRMDTNGDGLVGRLEFLCDRLIRDELATQEAIDEIIENFGRLDKDKSGFIHMSDANANHV